jgi:hypothetical protein
MIFQPVSFGIIRPDKPEKWPLRPKDTKEIIGLNLSLCFGVLVAI